MFSLLMCLFQLKSCDHIDLQPLLIHPLALKNPHTYHAVAVLLLVFLPGSQAALSSDAHEYFRIFPDNRPKNEPNQNSVLLSTDT